MLWEIILALNFFIIFAAIFCYSLAFSINKIRSSKEEMYACLLARSYLQQMFISNNLNSSEKSFIYDKYSLNIKIENDLKLIGFKNIFLKIKWDKKELNFLSGIYVNNNKNNVIY